VEQESLARITARRYGRYSMVEHVERRRLDIDAALGVRIGELLGCGRGGGCVFASDPGLVVKFTESRRELAAWQALEREQRRQRLPGFPVVERIAELRPSVRAAPFYAIVREDVRPLLEFDSNLAYDLASLMDEYIYQQPEDTLARKDLDRETEEQVLDAFARRMKAMGTEMAESYPHMAPELRAFAESLSKLMFSGVRISDWHAGNLGMRGDREVVLYDFEAPERSVRSWEILEANR
jgi:hypothetical protein